jgi:hypothetical protein
VGSPLTIQVRVLRHFPSETESEHNLSCRSRRRPVTQNAKHPARRSPESGVLGPRSEVRGP